MWLLWIIAITLLSTQHCFGPMGTNRDTVIPVWHKNVWSLWINNKRRLVAAFWSILLSALNKPIEVWIILESLLHTYVPYRILMMLLLQGWHYNIGWTDWLWKSHFPNRSSRKGWQSVGSRMEFRVLLILGGIDTNGETVLMAGNVFPFVWL